jgi:hypothetical protein
MAILRRLVDILQHTHSILAVTFPTRRQGMKITLATAVRSQIRIRSDTNAGRIRIRTDLDNFALVESDLFDKKSVKFIQKYALQLIISSLIPYGTVHTSTGKSCCRTQFCYFLHSA